MNSKKLLNADWGLNHQGNGISQQLEYETYLFDTFMSAKGGNGKGKPTNEEPVTDPVITSTYTSGNELVLDSIEFNIHIDFYGDNWTEDLKGDFINAADFLSTLITNDVAPDGYDDITIDASLVEIDGSDGILGQAGPTHIWTANDLSSKAVMEFDVVDAAVFDSYGLWDDIVLHEMLHSIGFGTLWDRLGLIENIVIDDNGTKKPTDDIIGTVFTGANAIGKEIYSNDYPLVETDGGSGTAGGHWDEETYENELMTGYVNNPNYLSDMSYGALEDMGYIVNYEANPADFFIA